MTSSLKDRIAEAQGLRDALKVVSEEPRLSGALKVSGGGVKGAVAFSKGKLVGAFVDKTGETGAVALDKLLNVSGASIKYAKFDEKQIVQAERIEVDIQQLLKNVIDNEKAKSADDGATPADSESKVAEVESKPADPESKSGGAPILNKLQEVVASTVPLPEDDTDEPVISALATPAASTQSDKSSILDRPMSENEAETVEIKIDLSDLFPENSQLLKESAEEPKAEVQAEEPKAEAQVEQPAAVKADQVDDITTGQEEIIEEPLTAPEFEEVSPPLTDNKTLAMPMADLDLSDEAILADVAAAEKKAADDKAAAEKAAAEKVAEPAAELVYDPAKDPLNKKDYDPNATVETDTSAAFSQPLITPVEIPAEINIEVLTGEQAQKEFAVEENLLRDGPGLTDAQRQLLDELGKNMSDEEAFHEADPALEELDSDMELTEHQLELLASAPLDEKSFDFVERPLEPEGTPSLNAEQQAALDMARNEMRDIDTFEQLDDFLAEKGLKLTSDQLWQLGEVMFARSREEMEEEFAKRDEALKLQEQTEFRDFVDPEKPSPVADDLDAIPTPKTIDADYSPLIAMQEEELEKRKESKGIIGRVRDVLRGDVAIYEGPRRKRKKQDEFPVGKLIGSVTLLGLCLGIFTIPSAIREAATGKTSEQLAAEQMRLIINEDLNVDPVSSAKDVIRGGGFHGQGSTSGGRGGPNNDVESALENDQLAFARSLAQKGNIETAIGYYEQYIAAHPNSVTARIELINAYLLTNRKDKARAMCMDTLKQNLTPSEIAMVWSLIRQCLTTRGE